MLHKKREAKMNLENALQTPYYCKIEVRGRLDVQSAGLFLGLAVERDDEGTVLEGLIKSHLDLCGYLLQLSSLNLPVSALSYSEVGEDDSAAELF
jgi:hypothetical protein